MSELPMRIFAHRLKSQRSFRPGFCLPGPGAVQYTWNGPGNVRIGGSW